MCLILVLPVAVIVRLSVPVICLVIGVEVAGVAVVDRHSTLFGHMSWLSASVAIICCLLSFCSISSWLIVVVPLAFSFVAVSFSFAISLLSLYLCLFLCCCMLFLCHILVVLVSFAFSFVAVPFSFERISLFNRLLIVFAFSSFVVVAAVVVPVAAIVFAFVVLSFPLALAFVSLAVVVPR